METIASIENLEDLAGAVGTCNQATSDSVGGTSASLDQLVDGAGSALTAAMQALEDAQQEVARLESRIDSLESQLDSDDKEERERAESEIAAAEAELQEAKDRLAKCEARREKVAGISRKAEMLRERFLERGRTALSRLADIEQECVARLRRACEALERYAAEHPHSSAAAFANWIRWAPSRSELVSPAALAERLRLPPPQLREMVAYETARDPRFRAKIEDYGRRWSAATTLLEKTAVIRQARRNTSGELAERIVKAAFRPLGDVSTQGRTVFEDGRYTKTDLVVRNLRAPVLLGKGDHAFAPKGGTLALEVKAGQAGYLRQQADHLVFQAGGHRAANASATICTADIHDLPDDDERALRDRVRAAGSPMIGMLPRKSDIDRALFEAIAYGIGKGKDIA